MRINLIFIILYSIIVLCSSTSAFGGDNYFDLYLLAKNNDSALKRSEARLAGSKAESSIIMASLFPHLEASAGIDYIDQTILNYSATDTKGSVLGHSYGFNARLNLLHVPTIMSLKAAESGIRSEELGVVFAHQDLILRYSEAYFGLLKAQLDKIVELDELARVKQVLDQSEAFLRVGTGDIIAVYEAKARYDSVAADLSRIDSNLQLAEQKLVTIVGKQVASIAEYVPEGPLLPQPDDPDWWVTEMERHDPIIQQAREGTKRATSELKAIKAEYLPVLSASGGYNVSKGALFLPNVETHQWSMGATVTLPLYSGGETSARVQRAVASESERWYSQDEMRKQRTDNLKQAFYNLRSNVSYVKSLKQRLMSAETQLAAIKKGRTIGTRSAVDVLNAEQAYSIAVRDHKNALYDNILRTLQLYSVAGTLTEDSIQTLLRK